MMAKMRKSGSEQKDTSIAILGMFNGRLGGFLRCWRFSMRGDILRVSLAVREGVRWMECLP